MSSAFDGLPKTPNLKLNKPGYDNVADIEALNENADILDAEIQGIKNTFVKSVNGINAGDGGNVDLGIIPISQGGTGASTAEQARTNLGIKDIATYDVLPIANGGTGATSASQARTNLGLSTAVTGASISGTEITLIFADGTTKTLTTQDNGYHTGNATSIGGASATKPAVIVDSYRSGTEWYRVWSDGWVEQGGVVVTSSGNSKTATLLKPFADTNYTIVGQAVESGSNFRNGSTTDVVDKKATSFRIGIYGGGSNNNWIAMGKGA